MSNRSIAEQLIYSTIRIETSNNTGEKGHGTGYFFKFLEHGEDFVPAIVTNTHVVRDAKVGRLLFHTALDTSQLPFTGRYDCTVEDFERTWSPHPDPEIDLSVMPISALAEDCLKSGTKLHFTLLDKSIIPGSEIIDTLDVIEDVIMVGYPNSAWDDFNNLPVIRKGITATPLVKNFKNKPEFLVDIACFPGSSGSPVFILNKGSYTDKYGATRMGSNRLILLGTVHSVYQHIAEGKIGRIPLPAKQSEISLTGIPNNLAIAIKSHEILKFEEVLQARQMSEKIT